MQEPLIRKASGGEMLRLWGYDSLDGASPTARYFYLQISSGNAVFLTADMNGQLIGELYIFFDLDDRDFADGTNTAYLCAFRVQEEYRGRGIGSRLMDAALAGLRALGFRRATIGVGFDEERNIEMYRRMGFDRKIKDCFADPCAMDEHMRPMPDEGFMLLAKELR